MKFSIIK